MSDPVVTQFPASRAQTGTDRVLVCCPANVSGVVSWLVACAKDHAGRRVVLDLRNASWLPDPAALVDLLTRLDMVVEGVHGLDGAFPAGVRAVVESQLSRPWCAVPEIEPLVVRGRVRAGQVVRHDAGDVDVLASVMPGGEVIAGGSVRVVGALSGKVRAGCLNAVGPASQVLCGALQAQVVSIDGRYVTGDRMPPDLIGLPARVHVRDGRMRFDSVDPVTVSTVEERAMAGLPPGLASLAS